MDINNAEDVRKLTVNNLLNDNDTKNLYDDIMNQIIDSANKGSSSIKYATSAVKLFNSNIVFILKCKGFTVNEYKYPDHIVELWITWEI